MSVSDVVKKVSGGVDTALKAIEEKANSIDDSIERRKRIRTLNKEFNEHVSDLVEVVCSIDEVKLEQIPEEIKFHMTSMREKLDEINSLEIKILEEKDLKKCPDCGTNQNSIVNFCSNCGHDFINE